MAKVKFVLNKNGVRQMMQSQEMMSICSDHASRMVSSLGDGYEMSTQIGKFRAIAEVAAVSLEARKENLENNTILKALGG